MNKYLMLAKIFPILNHHSVETQINSKPKIVKYSVFQLKDKKYLLILLDFMSKKFNNDNESQYIIELWSSIDINPFERHSFHLEKNRFKQSYLFEALIYYQKKYNVLIKQKYKLINI